MDRPIYRTPEEVPPPDRLADLTDWEVEQYLEVERELESRKIEALALYDPLPFQSAYHACRNKEAVFVKGNQVGASLAGYVEVARAVTGKDPHHKYPQNNGVVACLGYGEKHIGRVIHKYLFRVDAFKIIQDRDTGEWRTFRPWEPETCIFGKYGDNDRKSEARPAPPLIPERYIDGKLSFEKRSEWIFSYAKFTTGWELHALNSAGDPSQAQGFQCDLYDIDEDVAAPGWHEEAVGRTAMRKGLIRWHAIPHAKTEDLMNMIQRADDEEEAGIPPAERTTIKIAATMYDNPYYPDESKRHNEKIWKSQGEEVFRKRALGEVVLDSVMMYPTFHRRIHDAYSLDPEACEVQKILTQRNGQPPPDWCRYMSVDPGHTVCAVLFGAAPPPELGNYRVIYDECYLTNADKHIFARHTKAKIGDDTFQDFIIDAHGGRLRELGSGILPKRQYESEMEKLGIRCVARESRFMAGSDDIKGREEKLREWLSLNEQGFPTLLVWIRNCPNLVREITRFKKKVVRIGGQDVPTDDGNRRGNTHAVEALEYLAAHGMPYIKPKRRVNTGGIVSQIKEERRRRAAKRAAQHMGEQSSHRSLGPRGAPV